MSVQQAERSGWSRFIDAFTGALPRKRAEAEAESPDPGSGIEAERAPLIGISRGHRNDLVEALAKGTGGQGHDRIREMPPGRVASGPPRTGTIPPAIAR